MRITFLSRTGQPIPQYGDLAKKNNFFTEHLPVAAFLILIAIISIIAFITIKKCTFTV